jgi:hypothetical protein
MTIVISKDIFAGFHHVIHKEPLLCKETRQLPVIGCQLSVMGQMLDTGRSEVKIPP